MHEDHRKRLRAKLALDENAINEYEALELLLFTALPRVNTNGIAHRLINEFGSIEGVLSAPIESLKQIEGIGEAAAAFLATIGLITRKYATPCDTIPLDFDFQSARQPLIDEFSRFKQEVFLILFLNRRQKIVAKRFITGHKANKVDIDLNEFTSMIVAQKPAFVVFVHNHLSGNVHPSRADDRATEKMYMVLALNNVELLDHIIVSKNSAYSYYYSDDRLNLIKQRALEALS